MNYAACYLDVINEAYPQLYITSATLNQQGQNNDILVAWCSGGCVEAPGNLVFRFPRYPDVLAQLRAETDVLRELQRRLPLPVPVPSFVCLDGREVGKAFTGYRMLPGAPLWPEIFTGVRSDAVLDRLAAQLGGFLHALHGTPSEAIPVELPRMETRDRLHAFYERIRASLFPRMRDDARVQVTAHFEQYLENAGHFSYTPVLRHGDFGTSNILYDTGLRRVTGIVDFSGVAWGDPACDVAGLLASYGERLVARCAEVYPEIETCMERARFYRDTFALEEALFGLDHGDSDAFRAGMMAYV